MWPLLTGLVTGGASLLGSMFSSSTSASNTQAQIAAQQDMQAHTEQFNAEQAGLNRQFQEQMSNTAFQRSRQDAMQAGLNPMVLAGMGGASTPSGSSASVSTPSVPMPQNSHPLAGVGDAVGKAVNGAIALKTYDKMTEEIANLQATQAKTSAEAELRKQETATERHETTRRMNEAELAALRFPGARFSAKQAEDLLSMPEWARSAAVQGGFLGGKASEALAPVTSSARTILNALPKSRSGKRTTTDDFGNERTTTFDERFGASFGR